MEGDEPGASGGLRRRPPRFAATKLTPPPRPTTMVHRSALLARLEDAPDLALRLVVGSPGSGKSCLLADWARAQPPGTGAWVTADAADVDPARFWQAVITAVQGVAPGFGEEAFDLLTLDGTVQADALESLLIDADALVDRVTLVIDDLHLAGPAVATQLGFLWSRGAGRLRVAVGTRSEPAIGLGRLRLEGRLCEVRERDLRLAAEETSALVAGLDLALSAADLAILQDRTEGWAAGVQLAAVALRDGPEPEGFLRRLAGTNQVISQYLSAELLEAQPPEVQRFLLDTCVVDELSPSLAAALCPGSPVTLAEVEEASLLLGRLDPDGATFRYHHLFADMLRYRLHAREPGHEATLHERAAAWYEAAGDPVRAFRHAWRAGRRTEAMAVVERSVLDAYFTGHPHSVLDATAALGDDDLRAAPGPAGSLALALTLEGHVKEGLGLCGRILALRGPELEVADRVPVLATRCLGRLVQGDLPGCAHDGAEVLALDAAAEQTGPWVSVARSMALRARTWLGDFRGTDEALAEIEVTSLSPIELVEHHSTAAVVRLMQARLDEADDHVGFALTALAAHPEHEPTVAALPLAVRGTVLLERGHLGAARSQLEDALQLSTPLRRPSSVLARLGLSRVEQAEAHFEGALHVLEQGRRVGGAGDGSHDGSLDVFAVALDERAARVLLAIGDLARAEPFVARLPEGGPRRTASALAEMARGRPDAALRELDAIGELRPGLPALALDVALVRLAAVLALGDDATVETEEVVDRIEATGFVVRAAAAGGDVLAAVLDAARRRPQSPVVERLLRTRPHAVAEDRPRVDLAVDALSERERTVLRYLVTAMSYREIADELYVSVNTVKTHVKNIIRKLHADSRAEAIRRARELHYL